MMMLRRTDAERNMHRFYALGILPTLFGEWTVISEWGRIGAPGRMQQSTYNNEISAMEALTRRLADKKRRGYRSTAQTLVRSQASRSAIQFAAASVRASSPTRPIACTPTGMPLGPLRPGTFTQGVPSMVQTPLRNEKPV